MTTSVTTAERLLANKQARDTSRYERHSVQAAARIGFRAQRAALAAYRRGERSSLLALVITELLKGKDELRDSMVFAHLRGLLRIRERIGTSLTLSVTSRAIDILCAWLLLSDDEVGDLSQRYDTHASRVLSDASESVEHRLREAMIEATSKGMHTREGIKLLRKAFDDSGITPRNSYQLEAIFRTQTQMAYSAARWQTDQDPAIQEILWGYKYVTVGDDRVRPEHQLLDGVTLPKEHSFWTTSFPPNGWNCRCQAIEIFEEREEVSAPGKAVEVDGVLVTAGPSKGFAFNPGIALQSIWET